MPQTFIYSQYDFNYQFNNEDDRVDGEDENWFLQYCFPEYFRTDYGFRSFIEYEEECIAGVTCGMDGESITNQDEETPVRYRRGNLIKTLPNLQLFSCHFYWNSKSPCILICLLI